MRLTFKDPSPLKAGRYKVELLGDQRGNVRPIADAGHRHRLRRQWRRPGMRGLRVHIEYRLTGPAGRRCSRYSALA